MIDTTRVERLLPPRWQGNTREAHWRRARAMRALAALLAACAALLLVHAVTTHRARTTVAVAARDLPAGAQLTSADVREATWSRDAHLPNLLSQSDAVGQVLTGAIAAGEPVTGSRVRAARGWPRAVGSAAAAGGSVIPVPVIAREVAQQVHEGDLVDVFGQNGDRIGRSLRVVARAVPAQIGSGSPVLFVAAGGTAATAITRAVADRDGQSGALIVALHVAS